MRRNQPLYGAPGQAYVYLNYGIHCLVNVVTEAHGSPAAVLIRALDPLDGIAVMRRRRARAMKGRRALPAARALPQYEICRGPGNLTMAMGITLGENRLDLLGDRLYVEDRGIRVDAIGWGPRIGIRVGTESPWRAWVAGNPAVSGPRPTL
jgi:DNA-3-methyladenine glycosylase